MLDLDEEESLTLVDLSEGQLCEHFLWNSRSVLTDLRMLMNLGMSPLVVVDSYPVD